MLAVLFIHILFNLIFFLFFFVFRSLISDSTFRSDIHLLTAVLTIIAHVDAYYLFHHPHRTFDSIDTVSVEVNRPVSLQAGLHFADAAIIIKVIVKIKTHRHFIIKTLLQIPRLIEAIFEGADNSSISVQLTLNVLHVTKLATHLRNVEIIH